MVIYLIYHVDTLTLKPGALHYIKDQSFTQFPGVEILRIVRNSAETVSFHQIPTPGN